MESLVVSIAAALVVLVGVFTGWLTVLNKRLSWEVALAGKKAEEALRSATEANQQLSGLTRSLGLERVEYPKRKLAHEVVTEYLRVGSKAWRHAVAAKVEAAAASVRENRGLSMAELQGWEK